MDKEENKKEYLAAIGRRKEATAQVRLWLNKKEGVIKVNDKNLNDYFPIFEFQKIVHDPMNLVKEAVNYNFTIKTSGGGVRGQAEAIRLGISRALVLLNKDYKPILKKAGFMTRDSRMKERKKPGLKGARRAPQWAKR